MADAPQLALQSVCIMSFGLEDHMVFQEEVHLHAEQLLNIHQQCQLEGKFRENDTLLSKCCVAAISRDIVRSNTACLEFHGFCVPIERTSFGCQKDKSGKKSPSRNCRRLIQPRSKTAGLSGGIARRCHANVVALKKEEVFVWHGTQGCCDLKKNNKRKLARADSNLKEVCYYHPGPLIGPKNCELGRTRLSPCGAITCHNKAGWLNWESGCTRAGAVMKRQPRF